LVIRIRNRCLQRKQADDDVELDEFNDEIESWIIDEFKKVGLETAKSVLIKTQKLCEYDRLEEETIEDVKRILSEEFED
jgi:N utilization substance protein A